LGTREGDLVGFKPEGDSLVGHKVEWFDEWNGKKYKLDTLQSLRSLYSFNSTVKIGVFSDAARSVPLTSLSAGQTAYFRVSARDALTGKPAIVRGVIMVYYNNSNGTPGGAIYTLKFGVTEKRLADAYRSYGEKVLEEQIVGTYEDSFVLPQNVDSVENVSIALEIGGGLVVEGMVIAPGVKYGKHVLVLGGAASSGDWQGTYELDEDRARIFGVADDFVGVLRGRGIYRSFAPGSHKVSLFVDGKDKGSMVVDVEKLKFGKTADVGVVLVEYKGKRPNGCGDGRDRDGDGLTGYGRDDDCDGWDEYEYRNFLLSYANRFFHESTNGKLGFEWHLFDNGGKWFPLGEVSAAGSSGGGPWVEEIADQAIHAATGIKRSKWVEGKNDARVMVVLSDQSQSSDVGGSGTTTTRIGDMVILPYGHAVTHELGHGYGVRQELYPVSGDNWPDSDVDGWSVMGASSGALFDVYSRVRLGIASEDLKRRDGDYKLGLGYQSFGAFTVKSAPLFSYVSGHRYLVEARSKAPHLTYFDRSLPYSAVVVYDVYTAASFWDVVTANPLARVGDSFQSPDGGVKIELIKNNLDVDGTAEVRVKTSISSNVQGAIIDGASWLWGKLTGKSGPRSNESFDLDLHAYYTLGGSQHHVGMNYGTGEYEKPEGVLAGGDLVIGEWILVPKAAQNVEFKVVNKKLRDYFAKHPDQLELYPGETKFSITYLNFDGDGKRTVTNPQLSSISLDEQEKAFSMPAIGFLDQQTVERPTPETIKQRVIVLLETQSYEIAYSQEFAGESRPEIPEQAFSKPGNYTIVWQSAGPTNELYSNDELLRRNVIEFSNEAYVQKDNLVELQDRHMPEGGDDGTKPPDIVTAAGDSTLLFAGVGVAAVLVIVVVLVFVLRQRSAVPPA
ncbi:hypothetical protein HYS54_04260, partial [Candidatus Micrarchaeota archaeon]|nr:hypothetical protein [Candidatus Micrarchaeota archaeon]